MARRLLGVRRLSATKTVISALVGLAIGVGLGWILESHGLDRDLAVVAAIVLGLIFTMLVIIIFEALADPTRAPRPGGTPNPVTAVRRYATRTRRSAEIAQIASRHGLGRGFGLARGDAMAPEEAAAYGVSLREAFEEAGGVFVKLGQVLATRPDLIPPETANELTKLHQDVEPATRDEIAPVIDGALGRPVDDVFAVFDWAPLGSASIGQVHRARLASGERVVVKVRRPGVEEVIDRDLQIALDVAALVEERSEQARKVGAVGVADQFAEQLRAELDYRIEARNTIEAAVSMGSNDLITVPAVFEELSGESVLVLELIDGEPLGRVGVVGGPDGRRLADELFRAEVEAMVGGLRFHADPHPGNVMLMPDGRIGLIDFGSAGRLDAFEQSAITDILGALSLNDPTMLRSAALCVGMGANEVDPGQLDRAFARLMADHLGPGAEPTAELLEDFLRITNDFELRLPPSVTEMLRALATVQGSLELLSPGFPIIAAAQDVGSERLTVSLRPDNLEEELRREVIRLAPVLRRAPHHLDRIADQIERGNLALKIRLFSHAEDVGVITRLANRAILAFIGATLGVVSAMLFRLDGGPTVSSNISLFDILAFIGLFAGAILIMRVVLEILRER